MILIACSVCVCSCSQPQVINNNWLNFTKNNSGLLDNYVQDIEVDTANNIWIASGNTYGGFFLKRTDGRLTMYDGKWYYYENPYLDNSRYFYENLFISKNGDKWMGKNGGDLEHTSSFYRFSAQKEWKAFNADDNTLDLVHFASLNDSIILVRNTAGIGTIMLGYETFQLAYGITYKENPSLLQFKESGDNSYLMSVLRTGRYPIGNIQVMNDSTIVSYTFNGISYFICRKSKFIFKKYFELPVGNLNGNQTLNQLNPGNIWKDNSDQIWISYKNGFYHYRNGLILGSHKQSPVLLNGILDLKFDKINTAWFVTDHSFLSFDGEKWKEIFINGNRDIDWFTCLEIDHNGNIWIGTRYQGIFVYNPNGLNIPWYE